MDQVTNLLLKSGVDEDKFGKVSFVRPFVPPEKGRKPVFQMGDDRVFSPNKFSQIQIRDLQILLLQSIEVKLAKKGKNHQYISRKIMKNLIPNKWNSFYKSMT